MAKPRTASKTKLAHNALKSNNRRPLPSSVINSVGLDQQFNKLPLAYNSAIELAENLQLVNWALNLWLGYTASFKFQANTGDDAKNKALELHVAERTRAKNCDVQRIFSAWQMIKSYGALRFLYGDSLIAKSQGGKLQIFEAWQIAKGKKAPKEVTDAGLVLDPGGFAVEKFAICKGASSGDLEHYQLAPWDSVIFDRFGLRPSGFRGVSPLLPAMETARYYMTASEFYWFKIKIASMFGLAIFGEDGDGGATGFQYNQPGTNPPDTTPPVVRKPLQFDLKPGLKLNLKEKSRAEFLESKSPPAEFLAYAKHSIRLILSCWGIPYSLWDSEAGNYSSMRGDFNLFKQSILDERDKNQQAGHEILEHLLEFDDAAGKLPVGLTYDGVDWELVPTATFILDQSKEVAAIKDKISIAACTYDDAARELGSLRSHAENVRLQSIEIKNATTAGVPLSRESSPGAAQVGGEPTDKTGKPTAQ